MVLPVIRVMLSLICRITELLFLVFSVYPVFVSQMLAVILLSVIHLTLCVAIQ